MATFFTTRCSQNVGKQLCRRFISFSRKPEPVDCKQRFALNLGLNQFHSKSVFFPNLIHSRGLNLSSISCCEVEEEAEAPAVSNEKPIDPSKDRTKVIPPEVSIRYLKSKAYRTTYGDEPVWVKYRRNFKGQFPPTKTRRTCIRQGMISTGNPCPICRDEYLVVHYSNVELLKQFICPHSGEIHPPVKTCVCMKKQFQLEVAIEQAKEQGLLTFEVPFRTYNYAEYYPQLRKKNDA